jgi:GH24 family phage-related lysozyme (muramidase)
VAALNATPNLGSIRISREQADELMPYAARPHWNGISRRFTPLTEPETLPSVQTVLLSLAYNRGANNPGMDPLRTPLEAGEWGEVADIIGSMQQDHRLRGIRIRRREETALIRAELDYLNT